MTIFIILTIFLVIMFALIWPTLEKSSRRDGELNTQRQPPTTLNHDSSEKHVSTQRSTQQEELEKVTLQMPSSFGTALLESSPKDTAQFIPYPNKTWVSPHVPEIETQAAMEEETERSWLEQPRDTIEIPAWSHDDINDDEEVLERSSSETFDLEDDVPQNIYQCGPLQIRVLHAELVVSRSKMHGKIERTQARPQIYLQGCKEPSTKATKLNNLQKLTLTDCDVEWQHLEDIDISIGLHFSRCNIEQTGLLHHIRFRDHLSLTEDTKIAGTLALKHCWFDGNVQFRGCQIQGSLDLQGSRFFRNLEIIHCQIEQELLLDDTMGSQQTKEEKRPSWNEQPFLNENTVHWKLFPYLIRAWTHLLFNPPPISRRQSEANEEYAERAKGQYHSYCFKVKHFHSWLVDHQPYSEFFTQIGWQSKMIWSAVRQSNSGLQNIGISQIPSEEEAIKQLRSTANIIIEQCQRWVQKELSSKKQEVEAKPPHAKALLLAECFSWELLRWADTSALPSLSELYRTTLQERTLGPVQDFVDYLQREKVAHGLFASSLVTRLTELLTNTTYELKDKQARYKNMGLWETSDLTFFKELHDHVILSKNSDPEEKLAETRLRLQAIAHWLSQHQQSLLSSGNSFAQLFDSSSRKLTKPPRWFEEFFQSLETKNKLIEGGFFPHTRLGLWSLLTRLEPSGRSIILGWCRIHHTNVGQGIAMQNLVALQSLSLFNVEVDSELSQDESRSYQDLGEGNLSFSLKNALLGPLLATNRAQKKQAHAATLELRRCVFGHNVVADRISVLGHLHMRQVEIHGNLSMQAAGANFASSNAMISHDWICERTTIEGDCNIANINVRMWYAPWIKVGGLTRAKFATFRTGMYAPFATLSGGLFLSQSTVGSLKEYASPPSSLIRLLQETDALRNWQLHTQNWRRTEDSTDLSLEKASQRLACGIVYLARATIGGDMMMSRLRCPNGFINFRQATVHGIFHCNGSQIAWAMLDGIQIHSEFNGKGMGVGRLDFPESEIGGSCFLKNLRHMKPMDGCPKGFYAEQDNGESRHGTHMTQRYVHVNGYAMHIRGSLILDDIGSKQESKLYPVGVSLQDATIEGLLQSSQGVFDVLNLAQLHLHGQLSLLQAKMQLLLLRGGRIDDKCILDGCDINVLKADYARFQRIRCQGLRVASSISLRESVVEGRFLVEKGTTPSGKIRSTKLQGVDFSCAIFERDIKLEVGTQLLVKQGNSPAHIRHFLDQIYQEQHWGEATQVGRGLEESQVFGSIDSQECSFQNFAFTRFSVQGTVRFNGSLFSGPQDLRYAIFHSLTDFSKCRFTTLEETPSGKEHSSETPRPKVDLTRTTFHGDVLFDHASSNIPLVLHRTVCNQMFSMREFQDEIPISKTTCSLPTLLTQATISFQGAVLQGTSDFTGTQLQAPLFFDAFVSHPKMDRKTLDVWNKKLRQLDRGKVKGYYESSPNHAEQQVERKLQYDRQQVFDTHRDLLSAVYEDHRMYGKADFWKGRNANSRLSQLMYHPSKSLWLLGCVLLLALGFNRFFPENQAMDLGTFCIACLGQLTRLLDGSELLSTVSSLWKYFINYGSHLVLVGVKGVVQWTHHMGWYTPDHEMSHLLLKATPMMDFASATTTLPSLLSPVELKAWSQAWDTSLLSVLTNGAVENKQLHALRFPNYLFTALSIFLLNVFLVALGRRYLRN